MVEPLEDRYIFLLWLVGIISVAVFLTTVVNGAYDQATQANRRRVLKIEACQTLFDQAAILSCIEHA